MAQLHSVGWAIVLFYRGVLRAAAGALQHPAHRRAAALAANFFSGAPAPAGAGLIMLPMFVSFEWGDWIARSPYLNAVWISGVALMMVSNVPTVSLKRIRIPPHFVVPTLLGIGVATAFLTTAPWPTLTCVGAVYLASIPLTIRASYRMRRTGAGARRRAAPSAAGPNCLRRPPCRPATPGRRRTNGDIEEPAMHAFNLKAEEKFDPKKHVERVLGRVAEGDVTVACWEPGQTSPYHCHPHATEIYFCFEGGGTMKTPDETVAVVPARSSCIRRANCMNGTGPAAHAAVPGPLRRRMSGRTKEWPSNPDWSPRPEDAEYFKAG